MDAVNILYGAIMGMVYGLHRLRKEKPEGRIPKGKRFARTVFLWSVAGGITATTPTPIAPDAVAATVAEIGVLGTAFDILYTRVKRRSRSNDGGS